jgi:hypothetical protein
MSVCALCGLDHPDGWAGYVAEEDRADWVRHALAARPQGEQLSLLDHPLTAERRGVESLPH